MRQLVKAAKAVWQFLDGWKTFLLVPLLVIEGHCAAQGCPGPFAYAGLVVDAIGWRQVMPAVDPGEVSKWGAITLALGHKVVKAWRQLRAGRPLKQLLSGA